MIVVALAAGLVSKSGSSNTIGNKASSTATTLQVGTTQPTQDSTQQSTPKSTQPQRWFTTQTFTGNGEKKTAIISVPGDWKIVWSCTGQDIDGVTADAVFTVLVYNADGTLADSAVNAICKAGSSPTKDDTEEHQSGSVYLDIASTGNWTIQIQELK